MKDLRVVCLIALLAPLAACSSHQLAAINILPVPPRDSRWEGDKPDHMQLPLKPSDRAELLTALRFGLSHDNQDRGSAVEPNAEATYGKLLDLLTGDLTLADLSKPGIQAWFQGSLVDQVIDAREESMPGTHGPVALRGAQSDGKYWWIFYRDRSDHLTKVMVVRLQALTNLIEKGK
jgi:hypothetical protein